MLIPDNRFPGDPIDVRAADSTRSKECLAVREMLDSYVEETLPARSVWQVDRHLAVCSACVAQLREIRRLLDVLHTVPLLDTSDRFMASLHAKLDDIESAHSRNVSLSERLRRWWESGRGAVPAYRRATLAAGLASGILALILGLQAVQRSAVPSASDPVSAAPVISDGGQVSVAAAANNPFGDPAADNLEMRSAGQAGGKPSVSL